MKDIEYKKHGYGEVYNETISIPDDMVFIECAPENTECGHYDGYQHFIGFSKDMRWVEEYESGDDNEVEETFQTGIHYEVLCGTLIIILDNIIPITPLKVVTFEELDTCFGISDLYFTKSSRESFVTQGIYHIKQILGTAGIVVDAVVKHNMGYNIENNTVLYIGQVVNNERSDSIIALYRGKDFSCMLEAFNKAVREAMERVIP